MHFIAPRLGGIYHTDERWKKREDAKGVEHILGWNIL